VWGGGCELQRGSVSVPVDRPVSGSGPEGTLLDLEPLRRNERQCLLLLYKCPDQGSQTGMHAEHKSLDSRLLSSGAGGRRGQWMGLRLGGAVSFLSCVALGAAYVGFLCAVRCRATACMVVGRADVGLSEKTVRWRWCVEGRMPS
jgi:hypothetical protein